MSDQADKLRQAIHNTGTKVSEKPREGGWLETASKGIAAEGTAAKEPFVKDTDAEGTVAKGILVKGTVGKGTAAKGTVAKGIFVKGHAAKGAAVKGATAKGAMSNIAVTNVPVAKIRPAKVYAVTSGKGGVGKTNVTVNLAIALSGLGYKVVMIDTDFGLSNIEILFRVTPKYSLFDVIRNGMGINDILCNGPMGVKFISGGSGVEGLTRVSREQLPEIIANLSILDKDFDIILIDTGAGITDTVISMALAADEIILVATPEPTSVTDAYALVKTIAHRDKGKGVNIIVNKADSPIEAIEVLSKLIQVSGRFLDMRLQKLGYILSDNSVVRSVKQQQPFVIGYPRSQASSSIRRIAQSLASSHQGAALKEGAGIAGFLRKITRVFNVHY